MSKARKQAFLPIRYTSGQEEEEKMLNITYHQGNANQNHEIIPGSTIKKIENNKCL